MKQTLLRSFLLAGITFGMTSIGFGQATGTSSQLNMRSSSAQVAENAPAFNNEHRSVPTIVYSGSNPLPSVVAVAGADPMPISGRYQFHTNGRPGHNIVVDPDNPNLIHAVAMMTTDNSEADTAAVSPSRRVFYTFSNDAGSTWSAPKILGSLRTGFPYMILVKRNGKNVPVIAAHQELSSNQIVSEIFAEQGDPGTGSFVEVKADRNSVEGGEKDLIWPVIAAAPDGNTIYMIADVFGKTDAFYEFGKFTYTDGAYTWSGWKTQPGANNGGFPSAGYASGGENIMNVASDGRIGIFWQSSDKNDAALYFITSSDQGATWPVDYDQYVAPGAFQTNGNITTAQEAAFSTYDFFWAGTNPIFMWNSALQVLAKSRFYPSLMSIMVGIPRLQQTVSPVGSLNSSQFLISEIALAEKPGMGFLGVGMIGYPTIAHTSDTNRFAIYFQTYTGDDTVLVGPLASDTTIKTFLFGSIYMTETLDGGVTWSEPKPVERNIYDQTNPQPVEEKIDYRYPDVSAWNPLVNGDAQYHLMFMADSAAGYLAYSGLPGWDDVTFFHKTSISSGVNAAGGFTNSIDLQQNYPNPFNPSTTIRFAVEKAGYATIEVKDMLGRRVATVLNGYVSAGSHTESFDAKGLTSGIYEYTLTSNGESVSRRMILNK